MPKLDRSRVPEILALMKKRYPEVTTALDHQDAFELLAATILSAQTTDKRVNMVTPGLFARYPDAAALARADTSEVEKLVGSVNFFRNKAKNLVAMAKQLVERHGGQVPRSMEELVALPGVARKTANVVLGTSFGIASGVVVDTHVARVSALLGLTRESDPAKIEQDLMKAVPQGEWIHFSHRLIFHGRDTCIARRPQCDACVLNGVCPSAFVAQGYSGERAAARSERGVAKKEKATKAAKKTSTKALRLRGRTTKKPTRKR